jgi:ornithine cyclodeaminase/alanine dehydrogenase-like protein (mu-crystallin family)
MQLRILSAAEVARALPMADAILGMKDAFRQLSSGQADMPLRPRIAVPANDGVTLFMPAYLAGTGDFGVKVVSIFNNNPARNLPLIYAAVLALDSQTGQPLALLEGGSITAIRTGAGSGAATDVLARPEARSAAILGSGVQARTQLEAVCTVRSIEEVRVYSPNAEHARRFAAEMAGQGPVPQAVRVADSPAEAVRGADVVCAATTSSTPVFDGRDLAPGAHVNGVGSYTPAMQEVDVETLRRALVVVDSRTSALAEAGDLIVPLQAGLIDETHIHAELGQILAGLKPGRASPEQITYFKGCGVAVQDAVAASRALANAERLGLGTTVEL